MITIVSTNLPRRVRGVLKIWLLEVKAGIFCGNLNEKLETRILKFLLTYMNEKYELLIIRSNGTAPQGLEIHAYNATNIEVVSGLQLTKISQKTQD